MDETPDSRPTKPEDPRVIDDAQTMRALSHPVRLALLDALGLHGPLTATQAGERIGESPTTCSFHLRQLHRFGFVEEVGGGKGRARPWRRVQARISMSTEQPDADARIAAGALTRLYLQRDLARLQRWMDTSSAYPAAWRESATYNSRTIWMTPEELLQLESEMRALIAPRFAERAEDPDARPTGALPVEILSYSFPVDHLTGGS